MSYSRFSNGVYSPQSDVYLYPDVSGFINCMSCRLTRFKNGLYDDVHFQSRTEAIKHIKEHKAKGHKVARGAIKRLKDEIKELGDKVE